MKTEPLFVIPDGLPENRKVEPVEEKPKIPLELPEKDRGGEKEEAADKGPDKKRKKNPPPDPHGRLGGTIDLTS